MNKVRVFGNFLSEIPCSASISKEKYAFNIKKGNLLWLPFFMKEWELIVFRTKFTNYCAGSPHFAFAKGG